jgi:hypothetical protein
MPFDITGYAPATGVLTLVAGDIEIHGETEAGTTTDYKTPSDLTVKLLASDSFVLFVGACGDRNQKLDPQSLVL